MFGGWKCAGCDDDGKNGDNRVYSTKIDFFNVIILKSFIPHICDGNVL